MKTNLLIVTLLAAIAGVAWAQKPPAVAPAPAANLPDDKAKLSYSIAFDIGSALKSRGFEIEEKSFLAGLRDGVGGAKPALSDKEMRDVIMAAQKDASTKIPEKNKKDGEAYLAANAKKPGVKTTKSGLQYKVLKEGTGPIPKATDKFKAHYTGTLVDGTKFDSSIDRGEPLVLGVTQVIPGWSEALQMMKVGSKWELAIPSDIAYGPEGGGRIPPNSVLVFEMELLGIEGEAVKAGK